MKTMSVMKMVLLIVTVNFSFAYSDADWSRHASIKEGETRENIYELSQDDLAELREKGFIHALKYPVNISGLLIPYEPMINFFKTKDDSLLKLILAKLGETQMGIKSEEDLYKWLGLNKFNDENATGIYRIPYPEGYKPDYYMGASIIDTKWGKGLSFSCAACHSANLFGTSVMGLTNKVTKANKLFVKAKQFLPFVPTKLFQKVGGATDEETFMLKRTKNNIGAVGVKDPLVVGLDTSLPQVALSLARRNSDDYATKNKILEAFPKRNMLEHKRADSKPAVWWNLKYKTRWLSDGSIVQGNPILTNFLWNEIGRGTDLKELEKWMKNNRETIKELTVAAFSTKAPKWTDFFPVSSINLNSAKRGEKIFNDTCKKCHGSYEKDWSLSRDGLVTAKTFETKRVIYHEKTPVKNVGTDPGRYEGMKAFSDDLNKLAISKWMKTVVEPQEGYVPPPLVGIWSRYPYLHNNSIPTLCDLFTAPNKRTKRFYQIPSESKEEDFNAECVGFPVGQNVPKNRRVVDNLIDTSKPGLRNTGHYKMFLDKKTGKEKYTRSQKLDLIMYLKTL
ncbi:MAG: hypothetical protein VX341_04415 [Bdellovibrionota bacterium]|nr:hypothetical protein [Bdellovibrionota bacterium]